MSGDLLNQPDDEQVVLQRFAKDASFFEVPATENALPVGLFLKDRYRIVSHLSSGGMADVYVVVDESYRSRPRRALKITQNPSPELEARFRNEYESQVQLRHDNIVPIYDIGKLNDRSWMVLDLVHGVSWDGVHGQPMPPTEDATQGPAFLTLDHLLKHLEKTKSRLSNRLAAELVEACAETVTAVHAKGFVHRDLKPSNIFLDIRTVAGTSRLLPRIGDFGIVKRIESEKGQRPLEGSRSAHVPQKTPPRLPMRRPKAKSRRGIRSMYSKTPAFLQAPSAPRPRHTTSNTKLKHRRQSAPSTWPPVKRTQCHPFSADRSLPAAQPDQVEVDTKRTMLTTTEAARHTWSIPPGTWHYMAPERWAGTSSSSIDVWALGVVLYETLTGQVPYNITVADIHHVKQARLNAIQDGMTPAAADIAAAQEIQTCFLAEAPAPHLLPVQQPHATIDRDLSEVCRTCLRTTASERYQSMSELAADLHRYLTHHPVSAYRAPLIHRATLWRRRRPVLAVALLLTTATFTLLTIGLAKYLGDRNRYVTTIENQKEDLALEAKRANEHTRQAALTSIDLLMQQGHTSFDQGNFHGATSAYLRAGDTAETNRAQIGPAAADSQQHIAARHALGALQTMPVITNILRRPAPLSGFRVHPNGRYALTLTAHEIALWDLSTSSPPVVHAPHEGDVRNAYFLTDSDRIVVYTSDGYLRFFTSSMQPIGEAHLGWGYLTGILTSSRSRRSLAVGTDFDSGEIRFASLDPQAATAQVVLQDEPLMQSIPYNYDSGIFQLVQQPTLSNSGTLFALCGDTTAHIFEWKSDKLTFKSRHPLLSPTTTAAISNDNAHITLGSADGHIRLYSINTWALQWDTYSLVGLPMQVEFTTSGSFVKIMGPLGTAVLYSANGKQFPVSAHTAPYITFDTSAQKQASTWDNRLRVTSNDAYSVSLSDTASTLGEFDIRTFPQNETIVGLRVADDEQSMIVWDKKGCGWIVFLQTDEYFSVGCGITSAAYTDGGAVVAVLTDNSYVRHWTIDPVKRTVEPARSQVHYDATKWLSFSASQQGDVIAGKSDDSGIIIVNNARSSESRRSRKKFASSLASIDDVRCDSGGAAVLVMGQEVTSSGDYNRQLCIADPVSDERFTSLSIPGGVHSFGEFPASRQWWACNVKGEIYSIDTKSRNVDRIGDISFMPAGCNVARNVDKLVLCAPPNSVGRVQILIWDARSRSPSLSFEFAGFVMSTALSRDGSLIAIASSDDSVHIVSAHTGRPIRTRWNDGLMALGLDFIECGGEPCLLFPTAIDNAVRLWKPMKASGLSDAAIRTIATEAVHASGIQGRIVQNTAAEDVNSPTQSHAQLFRATSRQAERFAYRSALAAEALGDYTEADRRWKAYSATFYRKHDRYTSNIHARRTSWLVALAEYDEADAAIALALQDDPTNPAALIWAAWNAWRRRDTEAQCKFAKSAIERITIEQQVSGMATAQGLSLAYSYKGHALGTYGDLTAAGVDFNEALKHGLPSGTQTAEAFFCESLCLAKSGEHGKLGERIASLSKLSTVSLTPQEAEFYIKSVLLLPDAEADTTRDALITRLIDVVARSFATENWVTKLACYRAIGSLRCGFPGSARKIFEGMPPIDSETSPTDMFMRALCTLVNGDMSAARNLVVEGQEQMAGLRAAAYHQGSGVDWYDVEYADLWLNEMRSRFAVAPSFFSEGSGHDVESLQQVVAALIKVDKRNEDEMCELLWNCARLRTLGEELPDKDIIESVSSELVSKSASRPEAWYLRIAILRLLGDSPRAGAICRGMWQEFENVPSASGVCLAALSICDDATVVSLRESIPTRIKHSANLGPRFFPIRMLAIGRTYPRDQLGHKYIDDCERFIRELGLREDYIAQGTLLWGKQNAGNLLEVGEALPKWKKDVVAQLQGGKFPTYVAVELWLLLKEIEDVQSSANRHN